VRNTDQLLTRLAGEIEEKQRFVDGLVEAAEKDGRDLSSQEMELVTRSRERMGELAPQVEQLKETRRISDESRRSLDEVARMFGDREGDKPREVQYRSAGAYVMDRWRAGLGQREAVERLDLFHRAAAHQTTTDNPGLLPEQILGPVVNFIDQARPLITALGPRQLPSGSWSRPHVTQHTQVGPQSGEKTELVSRKMIIGKIPVAATTLGGYVNVSRQDIDWTQPAVMDIVIADLAGQYAIETENKAADDFTTAATAGPTLPTGANDAATVAAAFWAAAATVLGNMKGAGRVFAVAPPQMMGLIGPVFPGVNPTNAQSLGFDTSALGSGGPVGSVAGIPVYVSAGVNNNTILVLSSAAVEIYEDRIGSLQVVEPSVLGVQVAYAGYFADLVIEPGGVVKIVKTP